MILSRMLGFVLVACFVMQASVAAQEEAAAPVAQVKEVAQEEDAEGELEGFEDVVVEVALDEGAEVLVEEEIVAVGVMELQQNEPMTFVAVRFCESRKAIARRACELDAKQQKAISALNKIWVSKELKKRNNPVKGGIVRGIVGFFNGPRAAPANDPASVLPKMKKAVEAAIRKELTEEQLVAYDKELDAARKFRYESHAGILTAVLDRHLFLSREQRQKLEVAISEWLYDSNKDLYWQFYLQNNNYLPQFPNKLLSEHLTEAQQTALKGMQTWNYDAAQMEWQMVQHNQVDFVIVDE